MKAKTVLDRLDFRSSIPAGHLVHAGRAQNTVGTVSELSGTAHLERGGSTQPVTSGMQVELKDKFTTDAGSHLTITLNDNSKLDLAEGSSLTIDEQCSAQGLRRQPRSACWAAISNRW